MAEESSGSSGSEHPSAAPTVEEQLAAANVVHGSKLEQLIRDNQDFHMLRPEEFHDNLRLPLWVRVYWRKLHPDGVYKGPSGGYPLVLKDYYQWMLQHQDLPVQQGDGDAR